MSVTTNFDLENIFWNLELQLENESKNENNNDNIKNNKENKKKFIKEYYFKNNLNLKRNDDKLNGLEIILKESFNSGVFETIGREMWEASLILCCIILKNLTKFCNSSVLELGSGVGIPSLLLVLLKQKYLLSKSEYDIGEVIITDFDDDILFNFENTLQEQFGDEITETPPSQTSFKISVSKLDWNGYIPSLGALLEENNNTNNQEDNGNNEDNEDNNSNSTPDSLISSCNIFIGSELIYTDIQEGLFHLIL